MAKLNGESLNIEEENIKKLIELFPEVNTDGKIDFGKLKQILGDYVDDSEERYRFVWNGKGDALRISQTPSTGTLRPDKESSKHWDETENLYIEGDNLEVLKLLQKSYFGKVKMIYIDPPYNTGNDFVYPDDYKDNLKNYKKLTGQVDGEGNSMTTNREYSGRYHTDWLNMMYPRLRLAKNLLKEDGVIFISIDDNEVHNLRKICDDVFGENNFIANICHKHRGGVSNDKIISNNHNHILFYAKNIRFIHKKRDEFGEVRTEKDFKNYIYNDHDGRGYYTLNPVTGPGGARKGNPYYEIMGITNYWRFSKARMESMIQDNLIVKKNNTLYQKTYRKDLEGKKKGATTWWESVGTTANGTNELNKLFNGKVFDFPKPVSLLSYILEYIEYEPDSIILDFFSGSATTAHAVMDLNAEDGGNRKFIMVQLPEPTDEKSEAYKAGYKNIAEIGKERIRRAGEQIKEELEEKYEKATEEERQNMKNPDDLDIGFRTFKLDSSNIKEWNPGKYKNIQTAIEDFETPYVPGRTEEDVVYEMMLKMGLDLTLPIEEVDVNGKTIYSIGYGLLMICLDENIDQTIAQKMIEIKNENHLDEFRVIFRDEGFASDTDKTNIKETLRSAGLAEESFITL